MVNSASYRASVWLQPENCDRSLLPWITTSRPNVLAISSALMMLSIVSSITTTRKLSFAVCRNPPGTFAQNCDAVPAPELLRPNGG